MTASKKQSKPKKGRAGKPNWRNRTLFHRDNLPILRGMNSESVDLIATDPPFNKSKDFHATPESLAEGASFQDRWSWEEDVHEDWADKITDDYPKLMEAIESARYAHSDGMGAFMCFMAVRLMEMHRILKPTGSIYLHCDPTASHYLKAVMDAIFGWQNFVNEIIWHYENASRGKKQWAKAHDVIFKYAKNRKHYQFNRDAVLVPFKSGMTEWRYKKGGQKGKPMPKGKTPDDVVRIPALNAMSKERTGYPTQKPIELYELFVKASSNRGEMVLDPFAGCATTCVAAEKHGRKWVGIDIWNKAHEVVIERLKREGFLKGPDGNESGRFSFGDVHYEQTPPARDDDGEEAAPFLRPKMEFFEPPGPKMSRKDMYRFLLRRHGPRCQGCDREFKDPRYLELDHNIPRSDGGMNHIRNRILLCGPCNRLKSNKYTLSGLRNINKKEGYMENSEGEHPLMREIREERE